jgi:GT2 family glycosyltransferase
MTFSIIVVSWNALPLIRRCLPSVIASTYSDFEVILADNASEDGTSAWVEEHFPSVRIVRHPRNWAFAKGNNRAVPHASGDILVFLNNDVIVTPDWLQPLAQHLSAHPNLGAVQPKLLQPDVHPPRFEYAGASGGHLDRFGFPFTRGRLFDTLEEDQGQYDDPADIFWATGAALAVRRDVFTRAGGFDDLFVMHMEEIDLCWRIRRLGFGVGVVPESVVYHIGGASLPKGNPRKDYLNFRNSLLMLRKNLPAEEWRRVLAARTAIDSLAVVRAMARGDFRGASAIVRAHADARRLYQRYAPASEGPVVLPSYRGSIVFDHFARGIHRYSDLPPGRFADLSTERR